MNKTKIEWCDYTWNPVTGCLHACGYCYARKIANRFRFADVAFNKPFTSFGIKTIVPDPSDGHFQPILWENRLDQPAKIKKPSRVFVVSMGDLFGEWVPDEWIERVFEACEMAVSGSLSALNPTQQSCLKKNGCSTSGSNAATSGFRCSRKTALLRSTYRAD